MSMRRDGQDSVRIARAVSGDRNREIHCTCMCHLQTRDCQANLSDLPLCAKTKMFKAASTYFCSKSIAS